VFFAFDSLTYSESHGLVISWGSGSSMSHVPKFCGVTKPHSCGPIELGAIRATEAVCRI